MCSALRSPFGDALGLESRPRVAVWGAACLYVFPGTEMRGAQPSGLAHCSSSGARSRAASAATWAPGLAMLSRVTTPLGSEPGSASEGVRCHCPRGRTCGVGWRWRRPVPPGGCPPRACPPDGVPHTRLGDICSGCWDIWGPSSPLPLMVGLVISSVSRCLLALGVCVASGAQRSVPGNCLPFSRFTPWEW